MVRGVEVSEAGAREVVEDTEEVTEAATKPVPAGTVSARNVERSCRMSPDNHAQNKSVRTAASR